MAHDFVKGYVSERPEGLPFALQLAIVGGGLLLVALVLRTWGSCRFHSDLSAAVASLLLGFPLVREAAKDLWKGQIHLNELAALGVLACMATGEYLSSGAISFFMIFSTLIEERSAHGARHSIESLIRLTPQTAMRLEGELEREVAASELSPGDRIRLRPGDRIPADGVVEAGISSCDQATITGESVPIDKFVGDEVYAGTINLMGSLDVRVTRTGGDTTLGQVQNIILAAEKTRPPVLRILDEQSGWYTPLVLMIAAVVLFFTGDMNRAIAIVVISCPCSLILSASTASVAALGAASRFGVLFKNVADLETARKVNAVVFDKTGTLTEGQLAVDHLELEDPEALLLAASLESRSRHPAALALVREAERRNLRLPEEVGDVREEVGFGVSGSVAGRRILVGKRAWLEKNSVATAPRQEPPLESIVLWISVDGRSVGWVSLRDTIRSDASQVMRELQDLGINRRLMVTGDRQRVAEEVARRIGCPEVHAEMLPSGKSDVVKSLISSGHVVAVVGDGVNDAPALAAANLSIAMGAIGSDVAIHSASIALMNNSLDRIPFIISLSKRTTAVIRQNLLFSVGLIAVVILGSAMGVVHPVLAVILHTCSSFVVIFNSARITQVDVMRPTTSQGSGFSLAEECS